MKTPLLFLLFILPYWAICQDYLTLQNGDKFNCKIISVSDSQVVFKRKGIIKKIPESSVTQIMYNNYLFIEHQQATQDTSLTYNFTQPLPIPVDPKIMYLSNAKTMQIWAGAFLAIGVGSGLYSASLEEPNMANYSLLDYQLEQEEYNAKKKVANVVIVITAGASIACLLASNYYTLKLVESKSKNITLKQQGLGLGLCYTFK